MRLNDKMGLKVIKQYDNNVEAFRGEVEDTRLEAKAKNTKKFRDQGQTLSRPRTKDTGASVLQNKRFSKIFFQAISTWGKQKKVFANFLRGFWRFPTKFQRFKK